MVSDQQARPISPAAKAAAEMKAVESETSEEARAENRVPNKEVQQVEVDGCLVWEVLLRKETAEDKYGFIQANGKLDFQTRLANPSPRPRTGGEAQTQRPPEESPLPGPQLLVVRRIHEGGLLDRWNKRHPAIAVKPQDRICTINGETSIEGMQREVREPKIVIKFQRYPERFSIHLKKDGRRLGFRFERPPTGIHMKEVRLTEVLAEGALPDNNRAEVEAKRWDRVALPDMLIVAANGITGDANAIAEELKRCEEVTIEFVRHDMTLQAALQAKHKIRMMAKMLPGGGGSMPAGASSNASPSSPGL